MSEKRIHISADRNSRLFWKEQFVSAPVVTLDGVVIPLVSEALSGENGFVVTEILDDRGRPKLASVVVDGETIDRVIARLTMRGRVEIVGERLEFGPRVPKDVNDKSHPRFIAGYAAGLHDGRLDRNIALAPQEPTNVEAAWQAYTDAQKPSVWGREVFEAGFLAASAAPEAHEPSIEDGRFQTWSLADFAGQCRMQARDNLDPEYSAFMAALAQRLADLAKTAPRNNRPVITDASVDVALAAYISAAGTSARAGIKAAIAAYLVNQTPLKDLSGGFEDYFTRQIEWSLQTFGPALRTKGVIAHIRKELREIEQKPHDLSEWVDLITLGMDGYWRHGGKASDLLPAFEANQRKNLARQWPDWRTLPDDVAIEHNRSSEDAKQPPADYQDVFGVSADGCFLINGSRFVVEGGPKPEEIKLVVTVDYSEAIKQHDAQIAKRVRAILKNPRKLRR